MSRRPQLSSTVSDELYKDVLEIKSKTKYTLSQTVEMLLERAVKEVKRKRKNAQTEGIE